MPVTTLTEFHHWLLAEEAVGAPFILLDTGEMPRSSCAANIAKHLNEFDEASGGNWVALDPQVIHAIAADPAQRRLLGVNGPVPEPNPTSPEGIGRILAALANRGHIVINHPAAFDAVGDHPRGFRAALGMPARGGEGYHIIIDPSGFPARCLAPLVADSFLEWVHHVRAA